MPHKRLKPNPEGDTLLNERKMSLRSYQSAAVELDVGTTTEIAPVGQVLFEDGLEMTSEAIQNLIVERKEELKREAEEKRQEGLGRIAAMKSRCGVNPLSQFPREIWAKILEDSRPQERYNMIQVHQLFHNLMSSNIIRDVMLPLALDHNLPLGRRLLKYGDYLDMKRIRMLRGLSREIRDSIDHWIEKDLLDKMRNEKIVQTENTVQFKLTDNEGVLNRIRNFPTGPTNRFFLRALDITLSSRYHKSTLPAPLRRGGGNEEDRERYTLVFRNFRQALLNLLEKVGDQILYLRLSLQRTQEIFSLGVDIPQIYDILREWLQLTPNLKWLVIKETWVSILMQDQDRMRMRYDPRVPRPQEPMPMPMPTLSKLERVDVHQFNAKPSFQHWDIVLDANPHVKYNIRFSYDHQDLNYHRRYAEPAVQRLSLEKVTLGDRLNYFWDLPLLQEVTMRSNWKLKLLRVHITAEGRPIDDIFKCLGAFPTLEDLVLRVNDFEIGGGGGSTTFLRLPQLKNFRIEFGPVMECLEKYYSFFSLQFLLPCGKLEKLAWYNLMLMHDTEWIRREMEGIGKHEDGMIDFEGGFGDLSRSDVWLVFPKLKMVDLKFQEEGWTNGDERNFRRRMFRRR